MHDPRLLKDPDTCSSCSQEIAGEQFLTQVNPPGGYGLPQVLVCDECMRKYFQHWIAEHWPTWPDKVTPLAPDAPGA